MLIEELKDLARFQEISDLFVGFEEQLHVIAQVFVELIDAETWPGLLDVSDDELDSTDPEGERAEDHLLKEVGQMSIFCSLGRLVQTHDRFVDGCLDAEQRLERLQW